jgi:hypothetical protein
VAESPHSSVAALHKRWAKLEDEHHELAIAIDRAEIQHAPATTTEDFVALLAVTLEHELDLASDIAFYGPADYPMTTRLLRELARRVPGYEFNSLRTANGQRNAL